MSSLLLDWLVRPSNERGIHFAQDDGSWTFSSYEALARAVWRASEQVAHERRPDLSVVSLILTNPRDFTVQFFGTLHAGAIPSPIVPPLPFDSVDEYTKHIAAILRIAQPSLVVTDAELVPTVQRALALAGVDCSVIEPPSADGTPKPANASRDAVALLQFTSGSTGTPRGVKVTFQNLEANVKMIRDWVKLTPQDVAASWLPVYHDMGLIGVILTSVAYQIDLWLLRPDQFVREPLRWLECFGRHGASVTASPNFGYSFCASRVPAEVLRGMDFSGWKTAIVGAERIDPCTLNAFAEHLGPFGFSRRAYLPAYGLAEATLAVTGEATSNVPRVASVERACLRFGEPVSVRCIAEIGGSLDRDEQAVTLVSCGPPLSTCDVWISDGRGRRLPDGVLGEITVESASVARGYCGDTGGSSTRFEGRVLFTGDAGFLHQGELFVLGRIGDSLKVRGRTIYMEDLEEKLTAAAGIGRGRCVTLNGIDEGAASVAIIIEGDDPQCVRSAARAARNLVGGSVRIRALLGPRGTIRRTSSGKPRRRHMWQSLLDGTLEGKLIVDSSSETPTVDGPSRAATIDVHPLLVLPRSADD